MTNQIPEDTASGGLSEGDLIDIFQQYPDASTLLAQAINQTRMAMCVADASKPDLPLIFVNKAFCQLTGYDQSEIIGRNCRFLQGPSTNDQRVAEIRSLIEGKQTGVVELLNYRKDGTSFWNALHIGPIYDSEGELRYYFGSQWNVSETVHAKAAEEQFNIIARELNHRIMNIFAVISSLISMSGSGVDTAEEAMSRARARVSALSAAHRATLDWAARDEQIGIEEMARILLSPYVETDEELPKMDGPHLAVNAEMVTPLGMVLHELATNSVKYGFFGDHAKSAEITWTTNTVVDENRREVNLVWREKFDPSKRAEVNSVGSGMRIIRALLTQLNAKVDVDHSDDFYETRICIPDFEFENVG